MLAGVLGDLWNWVSGVFERIGDVSPYWIVLALGLKTCESALLGLTWRNILRAAYPKGNLSFKTAWGASQGGTAINAIAPAQAGTAAMIGIFRTSIPGASVAGVTTAAFVQAAFFLGPERADGARRRRLPAAHGLEGLTLRRVGQLLRRRTRC